MQTENAKSSENSTTFKRSTGKKTKKETSNSKTTKKAKSKDSESESITPGEIDFTKMIEDSEGFFVPTEAAFKTAKSYIKMNDELNPVLTDRGLPCGHIIHAAGESDTGKSTFACEVMKNTQSDGGMALYALTELKFDMERAVGMGVDRDKVVFYKPRSLEIMFEKGFEFIRKVRKEHPEKPIAWIWDSISATPSDYELDDATTNHNMKAANAISGALRRHRFDIDELNVCFVMINRVYTKQTSTPWEKKTDTYGGKAPKGFASIQLEFSRLKTLKVERDKTKHVIGIKTQIESTKNHLNRPFQRVEINIDRLGFAFDDRKLEL